MTKAQRSEIKQRLDSAERQIDLALEALRQVADVFWLAKQPRVKDRMYSYIIPHLESWMDNPRESTSIPALRRELEQEP